ncbi:hypothetical protein DBB29_00705 [Pandoraea cepalis]|uniref:Adenylosuccinate synthase n=1 Tax=Pandoraea cepalis TaxID=2508294 RepID=A0AAW7MGX0_9BURK|nr:hypothetical protein [Pandoraea cepalis]MDN4572002.1 hypothetical protein [Pandoraea cepalis]MDN4576653.1 hypothetical protein [Pandoraea cepalis]
MPGDLHQELVTIGARWLKRQGFGVVATELAAVGSAEQADVIGFRGSCSALIEAKAWRADFLADARKPHRAAGGLGVYRFYLCPPGVIEVGDLPPRWGLLHAVGRGVVEVLRPTGNLWPAYGTAAGDWLHFQHAPDEGAERSVLYSIARRRSLSRSDQQYERLLKSERARASSLARRNDELAEQVRRLQLSLNEPDGQRSVLELKAAIRRKIA